MLEKRRYGSTIVGEPREQDESLREYSYLWQFSLIPDFGLLPSQMQHHLKSAVTGIDCSREGAHVLEGQTGRGRAADLAGAGID